MFLRWAAAYSESELVAAAERAVYGRIRWDADEDLIWDVREPVVLFDAAWPGTAMELDNHLVIDLEPGCYQVRATHLTDQDNSMIMVQLQPTATRSEKRYAP